MNDERLLDPSTVLTYEEIEELQSLCYEHGNTCFPIDMFFNDIRDNKSPTFQKNQAYKDLWIMMNVYLELFEEHEVFKILQRRAMINKDYWLMAIEHEIENAMISEEEGNVIKTVLLRANKER